MNDSNDLYSLVSDIETELKPIIDYLQIIYLDDEIVYNGIGLKHGITFNDLKQDKVIPQETTRKEFIKLLDWFNENRKEVKEIIIKMKR